MQNIRSYIFKNAWNDRVILEILAETINMDEN